MGACCVPHHPLPCRGYASSPTPLQGSILERLGCIISWGRPSGSYGPLPVLSLFPDLPGREQHHAPAVMAKSHSFHFAFPAQGIAVSPNAPSFLKLSFVKCLITAMRKLTVTLSKALLRERNPTHHCLSGCSPRDAAGHPCC